jgi:hypothetical protein
MDTQTVGPWVFLGLGTVGVLVAIGITLAAKARRGLWLLWVFGFASVGVGVYGPAFLEPYRKFLEPLMAMQEAPSQETYGEMMAKVGAGQLPPTYAQFGLAYALERPVEGMDELLAQAVSTATDPEGKAVLVAAQSVLDGKEKVVDELLQGRDLQKDDILQMDPATASRVARRLEKSDDEELRKRNLDRAALKNLTTPWTRPVGRER